MWQTQQMMYHRHQREKEADTPDDEAASERESGRHTRCGTSGIREKTWQKYQKAYQRHPRENVEEASDDVPASSERERGRHTR
jgi:hypothetical protein